MILVATPKLISNVSSPCFRRLLVFQSMVTNQSLQRDMGVYHTRLTWLSQLRNLHVNLPTYSMKQV